jgi:hypothetical protein
MINLSPTKKKTRAVNLPGSSVGKLRRNLYHQAFDHIANAMDNGFYLEAITLIESLISDRLESRLTQILGNDFSFRTLNDLIEQTRKNEPDEMLKNLVTIDLNEWRKQRNSSLHEMVKVQAGDESTWECRVMKLPFIATNGLELLRKIAKRVQYFQSVTKKGANQAPNVPMIITSPE